jgi:hypothetical protein
MTQPQKQPICGKTCRLTSATFADASAMPAASGPMLRAGRRFPLFAQFPPAALFTAIRKAATRRMTDRLVTNGTGLANGRLRRASGGS